VELRHRCRHRQRIDQAGDASRSDAYPVDRPKVRRDRVLRSHRVAENFVPAPRCDARTISGARARRWTRWSSAPPAEPAAGNPPADRPPDRPAAAAGGAVAGEAARGDAAGVTPQPVDHGSANQPAGQPVPDR
jgi:hypothetical protein